MPTHQLFRALRPLYVQVLVGASLGVLVGLVWPEFGVAAKPLGDAFVELLKMLAAPIIFTTVAGLVVPTGYAFNLDGVCIYLTMAVVLIAKATNTDLTFGQEFVTLLVGLFTTKGMSGVPNGGFVALDATLSSVGHLPVAAIALLIGVDRFMGEARAVTSMIGNAVATFAVARCKGALDFGLARQVLAGHNSVMARPPQTFAPVPDSN